MSNNLPERVEEFLRYMQYNRKKSVNTVDGYGIDLRLLFRYLRYKKELSKQVNIKDIDKIDIENIDDKFIKSITISDLNNFISYVAIERKNKEAAQARKIATIKSFYNYMFKNDIIENNVAWKLESITIPEREPIYMTLEQTKKLTSTVKEQNSKFFQRDYTMIQLFLNCGFRLSELVGMNIPDINLKEKNITVIGKGNKQRKVSLNSNVLNIVTEYLEYRKNLEDSVNADNKLAVFLSKSFCRINKRDVERIVKRYMDSAELDTKKLHVHSCRHTAATLMYKYGKVDIRTLQKILGHSSPNVTQIYTHVDDEQMQEAVNTMPEF